jgi:hypothetical protein
MNQVMPVGTLLAFGLPPVGFIVAIVIYYLATGKEE